MGIKGEKMGKMDMRKFYKKMYAKRTTALLMAFIMVFTVVMPIATFAEGYYGEGFALDANIEFGDVGNSQDNYGDIAKPGYGDDVYGGDVPGIYEPNYGGDNDYNYGYNDYNYGYNDGYDYGNNDYNDGYDYDYKEVKEFQLIMPFGGADLSQHVTVTSWDIIRAADGVSIFCPINMNPIPNYGINHGGMIYRLHFDWEINLPAGQTIQQGDTFRINHPVICTQGTFRIMTSAWTNFTCQSTGAVIGRWRSIYLSHFEFEFHVPTAVGEASANGTKTTTYAGLGVTLGGTRPITFGGVPRTAIFSQRVLAPLPNITQRKSALAASNYSARWFIDSNLAGFRELTGIVGGGALGTNFTTVTGIYVEDTLSGTFHSVNFEHFVKAPVDLTSGFASNYAVGHINVNAHMTRIFPASGQSYADFKDSLIPFQWGVWSDTCGTQTFVAYFGNVGPGGATSPQNPQIPTTFPALAANRSIELGFFPEIDRAALETYFLTVYGPGNAIQGRMYNVRIVIREDFDPVAITTPIANTAYVTRNGITAPSTQTSTLSAPAGISALSPQTARVILMERGTNAAIRGATFVLQRLDGGSWVSTTYGTFTTDTTGRATTGVLSPGTYRFVQTGNGTNYAQSVTFNRAATPNAPYFNAELNTAVSAQFAITTGGSGQEVTVRNIYSPQFNVTYEVKGITPATFSPSVVSTLNHTAQAGEIVTVARAMTTTETTRQVAANSYSALAPMGAMVGTLPNAIDAFATIVATNAAGTSGTWEFNGWSAPGITVAANGTFTMPSNNVAFTGSWTFTPDTQQGGQNPQPGSPNLEIRKEADVSESENVRAGQTVRYTITIRNTGTAASGSITIIDTIPEGMTLVSGSPSPFATLSSDSRTLTWTINSLSAGATTTVHFSVIIDELPAGVYSRTFRNIALVNGAPTNEVVLGTERLRKHPDRMSVYVGDTINWTLSGFGNPIAGNVTNFGIIDRPGRGLNFVRATLPAFNNGEGVTFEIRYRVYGDIEWRTHSTNNSAASPTNFSLPQDGSTWYTYIGLYFGDVPAGFASGDEMIFTFYVGNDALGGRLVNRFFLTYNEEEKEGYSPDEPIVRQPGEELPKLRDEYGNYILDEDGNYIFIDGGDTPLGRWPGASGTTALTGGAPQTGVTDPGFGFMIASLLAMAALTLLGRKRKTATN